jgi:Domain of unknown function (DUF4861)
MRQNHFPPASRHFLAMVSRTFTIKAVCLAGLSLASMSAASAAESMEVVVKNPSGEARSGEVIAVPFPEVSSQLPGVLADHVSVTDAKTGKTIPAQVTNFRPEERKPTYDDLLFQHDFAAGEKEAKFVVAKTPETVPPFPARVFARYVPERLDDFAFENDRVAHRMYGPALDSPAAGKSRMISSGIDVWTKKVRYPIVDRWYLRGHDNYHIDTGEGIDTFGVGTSRGAGGTGIWKNDKLSVSKNWKSWKVLANGPERAVFELTYEPWDAGDGLMVSETKRITLDPGRNFHSIESTFTFEGGGEITAAVGLGKPTPKDGVVKKFEKNDGSPAWMSLWQETPKSGSIGSAVILSPKEQFAGFAEDEKNYLLLAKVKSGQPLRYSIGAGWDGSGDFADVTAWENYVTAFAKNLAAPLEVSWTAAH